MFWGESKTGCSNARSRHFCRLLQASSPLRTPERRPSLLCLLLRINCSAPSPSAKEVGGGQVSVGRLMLGGKGEGKWGQVWLGTVLGSQLEGAWCYRERKERRPQRDEGEFLTRCWGCPQNRQALLLCGRTLLEASSSLLCLGTGTSPHHQFHPVVTRAWLLPHPNWTAEAQIPPLGLTQMSC